MIRLLVWTLYDAAVMSVGQQSTPHLADVAVCLSGELRGFLDPMVQAALRANFYRANYDLFVATSTFFSTTDARLRVPIKAVAVQSYSQLSTTLAPRHCKSNSSSRTLMAIRIGECRPLMLAEERSRAHPYRYVVRSRPDKLWLPNMAHHSVEGLYVTQRDGRDLLLDGDWFAIGRREHADALLRVPAQVYCHPPWPPPVNPMCTASRQAIPEWVRTASRCSTFRICSCPASLSLVVMVIHI